MSPPSHRPADDRDDHGDHDRGLSRDLETLMQQRARRRRLLRWMAGAGTLGLAGAGASILLGCGGGGDAGDTVASGGDDTDTGGGSGDSSSCSVIPEETAGPYPGDGSNTSGGSVANALLLSGIVRSDIRSSIDGATGSAEGVPLTVQLRLVDTSESCADLSGYAVYLWHCDREGRYSMYSSGITGENYLRGVQQTDTDGLASFTTIFPGCYAGRMPHIHFEIYRDANTATSYSNKLATSQLAFPDAVCETVYGDADGYSSSLSNFQRISFATDNVFSDGYDTQLSSVSGSLAEGYAATLTVGIAV